jgi:hypothetical protein
VAAVPLRLILGSVIGFYLTVTSLPDSLGQVNLFLINPDLIESSIRDTDWRYVSYKRRFGRISLI